MTEIIAAAITAGLALLGTAIGSFSGFKLTSYRVEQLEKKVEKHSAAVSRTAVLEERLTEVARRVEGLERARHGSA